MQLRRFTSDSTPGALQAVREAFGDEAVILSNRQVDNQVEIIATGTLDEGALDSAVSYESPASGQHAPDDVTVSLSAAGRQAVAGEEPAQASGERRDTPRTSATKPPPEEVSGHPSAAVDSSDALPDDAPPDDGPRTEAADIDTASVIESLSRDLAEMSMDERPLTLGAVPATGVHEIGCEAAEAPRPDTAPASSAEASPGASRPPEPTLPRTADESVVGPTTVAAIGRILATAERRHAERARRLERRFLRLEVNLWGELEPLKSAHLRQLVRFGVGTELAVRLIERLEPDVDAEQAMRQSLALLRATLPVGTDLTGCRPGVTVLYGPAGGGKTTTLLKLAAEQIRRDGAQSAALISADFRIGAFESLRAYGRLLGIPVVQARNVDELSEHLDAFAHKPLVLVDHLPLERAATMRLPPPGALGDHEGEARVLRRLLVLPATLETRQFEAQVALHRAHAIDHAVLTQLDRATRLAACFGPLVRHALSVAYDSDDARVQMPLRKADASRLVATAMTTGREDKPSADEEILLNLLQPTRREMARVAGDERANPGAAPEGDEAASGTAAPTGEEPMRPSTRAESAATPGDAADAADAAEDAEDAAKDAAKDAAPSRGTEIAVPAGSGTLERIVSFEAIDDGSVLDDDTSDVIETQAVVEKEVSDAEPVKSHPGFTAWRVSEHGGRGRKRGGKKNRTRTERRG